MVASCRERNRSRAGPLSAQRGLFAGFAAKIGTVLVNGYRVKGHRHMSQLLKALDRLVLGKGLDENRKIA
jgi:hypothetical protein